MSDLTRDIVQGYLDAFDSYSITSPSLQEQVGDLARRMMGFADDNPDPGTFYAKFGESGLQEEHSALLSKIVMASLGAADADGNVKTDYSDTPTPTPISVRAFVEQYRTPYDEIKKAGYRKRGEAAYERLFAVADQTDDMLDAQIIIERERLLWELVRVDSLDVFEPVLQAMDPLQRATTITLEKQVEAYENAQSSEALDYLLERFEYEKIALAHRATSAMTLSLQLATLILGYCAQKLNTQRSGGQGEVGKKALHSMIASRSALKRTLRFLEDEMGMTFDELMADEGVKIWLLNPTNTDELGRVKIAMHPQNYDAISDIVHNEILSDLSTVELLRQTPDKAIWYAFDAGQRKRAFEAKAEERAKELNAHLTYYQYREQMNQTPTAQTAQAPQAAPQAAPKAPPQPSGAGKADVFNAVKSAAIQQPLEQGKALLKGLFGKRK